MPELGDLTIGVIPLALVIVALVEVAKRAGLPSQYAPWLNAVLAVAGYALVLLVQSRPDLLPTVETGLTALVIFLSAAGIYDRTGSAVNRAFGVTHR